MVSAGLVIRQILSGVGGQMVMGNLAVADVPMAKVTDSAGRDRREAENHGSWTRSSGRTYLYCLSGFATPGFEAHASVAPMSE